MESGVVVGSGVGYHYPLCLASLFHFESNSVCFFRYLFYALQVRNVWEHLKKTRFKFLFSCNHLLDLQFFFFFFTPSNLLSFLLYSWTMFFICLSSISYSLLCNCYRDLSTWLIWCIEYFILNYAVLFLSYSVYFSFLLQDEKGRFIKHFFWLFEGRPTPLLDFCFFLKKRRAVSFKTALSVGCPSLKCIRLLLSLTHTIIKAYLKIQ